jgi:hypothetical protein
MDSGRVAVGNFGILNDFFLCITCFLKLQSLTIHYTIFIPFYTFFLNFYTILRHFCLFWLIFDLFCTILAYFFHFFCPTARVCPRASAARSPCDQDSAGSACLGCQLPLPLFNCCCLLPLPTVNCQLLLFTATVNCLLSTVLNPT